MPFLWKTDLVELARQETSKLLQGCWSVRKEITLGDRILLHFYAPLLDHPVEPVFGHAERLRQLRDTQMSVQATWR